MSRSRILLTIFLALVADSPAGAASEPDPALAECLRAAEGELGRRAVRAEPLPPCRGLALTVVEDFLGHPLGKGASSIYEAYLEVFRREGDLAALDRLWQETKSPVLDRPGGDPRVAFEQMLLAPAIRQSAKVLALARDLIWTTGNTSLIHRAGEIGAFSLLIEVLGSDLPPEVRAAAASQLGYRDVREAIPLLDQVAFGEGPPSLVTAALQALDRLAPINTRERLAFAIEHVQGSAMAAHFFDRWWAARPGPPDLQRDARDLLALARRTGTPWATGALRRYVGVALPPPASPFPGSLSIPPPPVPPSAGGTVGSLRLVVPPPADPYQALRAALEADREAWRQAALAHYAMGRAIDSAGSGIALQALVVATGLANLMWGAEATGRGGLISGWTVQPYLPGVNPRTGMLTILSGTDRVRPRALALEASWSLAQWMPEAYRQVRMTQYLGWFGGVMALGLVGCIAFVRMGYGLAAGASLVVALAALVVAGPWLAPIADHAAWPPLALWMAPLRARIALAAGLAALVALPFRRRIAVAAAPVGALVAFVAIQAIWRRAGLTLRLVHYGSEGWELLFDPLTALVVAPPLAALLVASAQWVGRRAERR